MPTAIEIRCDRPNREPARRFLARVRSGEVEACGSTKVLQEILYRYASLKRLDLAAEVYDLFVQLCEVVYPVTLADTDAARAMLGRHANVSLRDALHAAVMRNHDVQTIATFDTGFDLIPGARRVSLA